jgi:predicted neuraminidase
METATGQVRAPSSDGICWSWEAESEWVGKHTNGVDWRVVEDASSSGGGWLLFYGEQSGDFIEFTLPDVLPGRYVVHMRFIAHSERGICRVSFGEADGSGQIAVGNPIDMNREAGHCDAELGPYLVESAGFRTVRLTVTGSSGERYKLGIDSVVLAEAPSRTIEPPAGLETSHIAPNHCVLRWNAARSEVDGYLIDRRGGKTDAWRVVGVAPGDTTRFVAAGLCDEADYAFRIAAHGKGGRSDYSEVVKLATPAGNHMMCGRVLSTSPGRIGGATMMRRDDGSLLMLAHYQEQLRDQGRFEIHKMISNDDGATWSDRQTLLAAPDRTYMMPALLRLQNGDALFCYTERNLELTWGKRWCQRSTDGGMTWSKPTLAMTDLPLQRDGLTLNMPTGPHDRLIQTSSGRVLFPVHFPWLPGKNHTAHSAPRIISSTVYFSDDQGRHWQRACEPMLVRGMTPAATKRRDLQGLWEPSIVELQPGELLMYLRSNTGWYYESRSHDDGTTWSAPRQSVVRAPLCPAKLVNLSGGRIGIILNGIIDYTHANLSRRWDLGTMISNNGGRTWTNYRSVEFRDPRETRFGLYYCYPTVLFDQDRLHMTYYGPACGQQFNLIYQQLPAVWFVESGDGSR